MNNYSLRISTRPKRLAFIIDAATFTPLQFNLLVFFCMGLWGGRHHAIVPANEGMISPAWLDYLKRSDPDYLISLFYLTPDLAKDISLSVQPCASLEFDLASTSLEDVLDILKTQINPLAIEGSAQPSRELRSNTIPGVQDLTPEQVSTNLSFGFLVRNFGAGIRDSLHALANNLRVRNLYFYSPGAPILLDRTFDERHTHLTELAREGHAFTSRPDFQVVFGDDMNDVAYFWARAGIGPGPMRAFDTLWLVADFGEVEAKPYVKVLATWISAWKRKKSPLVILGRPTENDFGNRLSSALAEALSETVNFRTLTEGDVLSLETSAEMFAQRPNNEDAHIINVSSEQASVVCQKPGHLVEPSSAGGSWIADISLRPNAPTPQPFTSFKDETWLLPQKRELWKLFLDEGTRARITKTGVLSLAQSARSPDVKLRIPSAELFLKAILRRWKSDDSGNQEEQWFGRISPSDKARPLENILRQYDSIGEMAACFSNPMVNETIQILLRKRKEDIQKKVEELLVTAPRPEELTVEELRKKRAQLARKICDSAFSETRRNCFTFEGISGLINNPQVWTPQQREEEELRVREGRDKWRSPQSLRQSLTQLTKKKLVLHGSELECSNCRSKDWYPIEAIVSDVRCQGCNSLFSPAVPITWSCAASAMFSEGLARHSMHPVLQTIAQLYAKASEHLIFSSSLDIHLPPGACPEKRELDLLAFIDGELILVEVKSSLTGLKDDLEATWTAMELIKPDLAMVSLPRVRRDEQLELGEIGFASAERLSPLGIPFQILEL